jgi:carbonic anhydrase
MDSRSIVMKSRLAVSLASILLVASATVSAAATATKSPAHAAGSSAPAAHGHAAPGITPSQALEQLESGNRRYTSAALVHPNQTPARRAEEAKGQKPIAVIVSCSDSRVPPEIVFDQGLGDLFVIRTAGNRLDDLVLASIEYSVEHLGTPLVVVLGHERCGAVTAAVEAAAQPLGTKPESPEASGSHIPVLVRKMSDAVAATASMPGDKVENAVVENVRIVVKGVTSESPYLAARVRAGALRVVGARYDLDTGKVTLVDGQTAGHAAK